MERAGRLTNLHSDPTKTVLIGTEMHNGKFHFPRDTLYLNGHPVRWPTSLDYFRVLDCHALSHRFHPADSRRLFSSTRPACRALCDSQLPANYPLARFVAKCHGTVNRFRSVRPPSLRAMCVLDALAGSLGHGHSTSRGAWDHLFKMLFSNPKIGDVGQRHF